MASTSSEELARELLESCLGGAQPREGTLEQLVERAASPEADVAVEGTRALFQGVVEPLADRFEPALCDAYVRLFTRAIRAIFDDTRPAELEARYRRIRRAPHYTDLPHRPERVYVLSRVTLGADIAITSIILDAAKKRFPDAEIVFAGPQKSWALFGGDRQLRHLDVSYGRDATLRARLEAGRRLEAAIAAEEGIVIDPDSRLTQLGLLPVCPEERYYFFESRSYGGDGSDSLTRLAERWVAEKLGVVDAKPYIAPAERMASQAAHGITVSLGVGENPAKRLADPFEARLLRGLTGMGLPLLVDKGAGGEEAARVSRAVEALGTEAAKVEVSEGAFAPFAGRIRGSRLYVGYDSAGQHAAAACGVARITIFAGFPCERMFQRWQPAGRGQSVVVRALNAQADEVLESALSAAGRLVGTP